MMRVLRKGAPKKGRVRKKVAKFSLEKGFSDDQWKRLFFRNNNG